MMGINPVLYDVADPAAAYARKRDDEFFVKYPRQSWRVRPLFEGESPLAEGMREAFGYRAYVIVIHHARAGDRRAKFGRGLYPLVVRDGDKHETRWILTQEAVRWAKWFRKHSTPPPPRAGVATVTGGAT